MGKAFASAVGVAAYVALAAVLPASASARDAARATLGTPMKSTVVAGFEYANYVAVPESLSATMVVPKLKCRTGDEQAVYAGIGVENETNAAGLVIGCNGKDAYYWPSLTVINTVKNDPSQAAHPGDKIELSIAQGSASTVSLIDVTHKFQVKQTGAGDATGDDLLVGEDAWDDPTAGGA
jgi:hypothetical protein